MNDDPVVVPDSIEPVYGWKGMMLGLEGKLVSPNMSNTWEPLQAFEASCSGKRGEHVWRALPWYSQDGMSEMPVEYQMNAAGNAFFPRFRASPERPRTILPTGMHWRVCWEEQEHRIADSGCSCGVHCADDPGMASNYGPVLVRMAGWGTMTKHTEGFRCQFAYPDLIYVQTNSERKLLADYGVPVLLFNEAPFALAIPRAVMTAPAPSVARLFATILAVAAAGFAVATLVAYAVERL